MDVIVMRPIPILILILRLIYWYLERRVPCERGVRSCDVAAAYDWVLHQAGTCNGCFRTLVLPRSALSQYSLRTYACELVLGPKRLNSAGFCRQTRSGFDCWMLRRGLPVKEVVWAASFAILIKIISLWIDTILLAYCTIWRILKR